jgi:gliding motility-associated-like protein
MRQFIQVKKTDSVQFSFAVDACAQKVKFVNQSNFAQSYIWYFGDGQQSKTTNAEHTYSTTGTFKVLLVANPGSRCADTEQKFITIPEKPRAALAYSIDSCTGIVTFRNLSVHASAYRWYFGDSAVSDSFVTEHAYASAGEYDVKLVANPGSACADTAVAQLNLPRGSAMGKIKVYNVFTPNNDGLNDYFRIDGLMHCENYELYIFNRWGQQLYHQYGNQLQWDGKFKGAPMPAATYFFLLRHNGDDIFQGAVDLVR